MKLRVIDYVANPGGGVRFAVELLRALMMRKSSPDIELVSHHRGLETYASLLGHDRARIRFLSLAPPRYWRTQPASRVPGLFGSGRIKRRLGFESQWHFDVPPGAVDRCDVAWFPWMLRHRIADVSGRHLVGSFHDAIVFVWPGLLDGAKLADERETVARWLDSQARIAVSSQHTVGTMIELFGVDPGRLSIIPLSGAHVHTAAREAVPRRWTWHSARYLLYAANTSPHKNHELLLTGFAGWGAHVPLVLTGYGTDLAPNDSRGQRLRDLASEMGLELGVSLIPVGYVSDGVYFALLDSAWAVVMPSLMEGGGSFPVMEAMLLGVPVICADLPVMREQLGRTGGEVLWFDPHDPSALSRALIELSTHEGAWRAKARAQAQQMHRRTWQDVADDYLRQFEAAAGERR